MTCSPAVYFVNGKNCQYLIEKKRLTELIVTCRYQDDRQPNCGFTEFMNPGETQSSLIIKQRHRFLTQRPVTAPQPRSQCVGS